MEHDSPLLSPLPLLRIPQYVKCMSGKYDMDKELRKIELTFADGHLVSRLASGDVIA